METINRPIAIQSNKKKQKKARQAFNQFIIDKEHPCVMAQTMFRSDRVDLHVYEDFGSDETAFEILSDLQNYLDNYDFGTNYFNTFIAVFTDEGPMSERDFEKRLWKQLQALHEADDQPWDRSVSDNPENETFSFSVLGNAFYIVGMHPNSSRKARQSPYPALTFNLHRQFEQLRKLGTYKQIRDTIRQRDVEFEGDFNPMLEDFGKKSEARQYSGRQVDEGWKCPFHHK